MSFLNPEEAALAEIAKDPDVELGMQTLRDLAKNANSDQVRYQAAIELLHIAGIFKKPDNE
jgi:hypothetical protein